MTGIVVGVDGSPGAAEALTWAAAEADRHGWSVTAVLARHADRQAKTDQSKATSDLDSYIEQALGPSLAGTVERRVIDEPAVPALLGAGAGASLLVVGARGLGGFRGLLLGSVSQHLLQHVPCPVAVIRPGTTTPARDAATAPVVVGIDGSDTARKAFRWAVEEGTVRRCPVVAVSAWNLPSTGGYPDGPAVLDPSLFEEAARSCLDDALASVDTGGLVQPVEPIVSGGGASAVILQAAEAADLIVVGTRGLGGFKGLVLGSVSHQVAHHAACPVIVVPSDA